MGTFCNHIVDAMLTLRSIENPQFSKQFPYLHLIGNEMAFALPWICIATIWVCMGFAWDLHGICMGFAWDLPWLGIGFASALYLLCLGFAMGLYLSCIRDAFVLR